MRESSGSSSYLSHGISFESGYILIDSYHELQDILIRISMPRASSQFDKLWVKVNPFADCDSLDFLAEVWGLDSRSGKSRPKCLHNSAGLR